MPRARATSTGLRHALRPLNQELVSLLNPEVSLTDLAQDISEIGYPQLEQESA